MPSHQGGGGGGGELHVAVLPFSAFGHIMPFLQLSIALAKSNIRVSFLSTPTIIQRLLPQLPDHCAHLVRFIPIPMPKIQGLPDGAEATVDIPFHLTEKLNAAYDLLLHNITQFLSSSSPRCHWLISDFAAHWAPPAAAQLGVSFLYYTVSSAASSAFFGSPRHLTGDARRQHRSTPESLAAPPPWFPFPSSVSYRRYDSPFVLASFYGRDATGISTAERIAGVLEATPAVAIRSCPEIEGEYLDLFRKLIGKPVIPVGMTPPAAEDQHRHQLGSPWAETFAWLDQQKPRSVVFVGFGSECKLSEEQIREIGEGLALSDLPFLWTLREGAEALAGDFGERTAGRGRVCAGGWAPQKEILGHAAIGGSLFHSGWGSVIETAMHGHAMVLLPLIIEQPLNARMLVDKGLAVEVEREEEHGGFRREDVARCLRFAMLDGDKEGEAMRARVKEAAAIIGDQKLQQKHMDGFVKYLMTVVPNPPSPSS